MSWDELLYFSLFFVGGLVTGYLVKKLVSPALKKITGKTKWAADDLIFESVSKWVVSWFAMLGVYLGWKHVELAMKYHRWLENGLLIFYVFSVTWIVAHVLAGMTKIRNANSGNVVASSSIIGNIIKVIVYCVGFLVVLQSLGISITPILTALGVGGLAVALALQDTLSNLFAGIQIIATKKINPGDFIRLDSGQDGFVEDISWRYTTLKTGTNNLVIIPNSKLAGVILSNFYFPNQEVQFDIMVGVDYNSDLEKVERVTIEVLKEVQKDFSDCVQQFEPFIRFQQFGESSIDFKAYLMTKTFGSQFLVKHELIKRIFKRFVQEGINIPFPVRQVYLEKSGKE